MMNVRHALAHLHRGDWAKAHSMVAEDNSRLGAWLHGILHMAENDMENARYWFTQAGRNFDAKGAFAEELAKLEAELLD